MKKPLYPTFVNLKDLQDDGEEFHYSRTTGELNKNLQDLVGSHPYQVEIGLRAIGNAFEIRGKIETALDLICARCGRDMVEKIEDKFSELIVVMDEKPRAGHSGHTGMSLEDGPFCNYSTSHSFDLGEFVREHVAAAEPYAPQCHKTDCEEHFLKAQKALASPEAEVEAGNPFQALKDLNVKSSSKRSN